MTTHQLEHRTPARCAAPWRSLKSLPPTSGQMDLALERTSRGTAWLFSVSWRRIVFLLSVLLVRVTMDIYSSTLSPALDIGTGCYLLVLGKLTATQAWVNDTVKLSTGGSKALYPWSRQWCLGKNNTLITMIWGLANTISSLFNYSSPVHSSCSRSLFGDSYP